MVDPYSYIRRPGFRSRLSLPKYLINSPGDQFFLPDAARFYWSRLPVEKRIRYVPNSDHSLRNTAAVFLNTLTGLLGWYSAALFDTPRPPISWFLKNSGTLVVRDPSPGATAKLWRATNPTALDFRLEAIDEAWTSPVLRRTLTGDHEARVPPPRSGWTAYFVEVTYPGVVPQIYSTQVFVRPTGPAPLRRSTLHKPVFARSTRKRSNGQDRARWTNTRACRYSDRRRRLQGAGAAFRATRGRRELFNWYGGLILTRHREDR